MAGATSALRASEEGQSAFEDLGFARVDLDRTRRRGYPEAIYCPGKTVDHIVRIARSLIRSGAENVLATRASEQVLDALTRSFPDALAISEARLCVLGPVVRTRVGKVAVVTRSNDSYQVAQEAAFTAEAMGSLVVRNFDAPLHLPQDLPQWVESLGSPNVIVAVDGEGGSLPSIVAGLSACLVVAVPASVGELDGIASLLAALNSCVPGVVTVNINNGYGAGYAAHVINARAVESPDLTTSIFDAAKREGVA